MLYSCQVWTRLTKDDEKCLSTIQLQFLKQILQVPRSTCNCFTYLELGVLPVTAVIHIRKLTFLHHILCLDHDDPVLLAYQQQMNYVAEKNWANECIQLRAKYNLKENDEEIALLSKEAWKERVKKIVTREVLQDLNEEKMSKKKVAATKIYESMEGEEYLTTLKPEHARILFRVRSGMSIVKEHRQYEYGEDDMLCRLCDCERETLGHVFQCKEMNSPMVNEGDEYSEDMDKLEAVAVRMCDFGAQVDKLNDCVESVNR